MKTIEQTKKDIKNRADANKKNKLEINLVGLQKESIKKISQKTKEINKVIIDNDFNHNSMGLSALNDRPMLQNTYSQPCSQGGFMQTSEPKKKTGFFASLIESCAGVFR
jgi:hypothetical protein